MTKSVLALRHVAFEDLGGFEALLREAGYAIHYCDMGLDDPLSAGEADLLAILGGPIGAYEENFYPFLKDEICLIAARLAAGKPVLGICLGAQLMARALGAGVYPGRAKEIGFKPLTLTPEGEALLGPLKDLPVLHWHGDTFDLPEGALHLASTPLCRNQAFSVGRNALGLQFHIELAGANIERWLVGHAIELAGANVSVTGLRADTKAFGAACAAKARQCLSDWLEGIDAGQQKTAWTG